MFSNKANKMLTVAYSARKDKQSSKRPSPGKQRENQRHQRSLLDRTDILEYLDVQYHFERHQKMTNAPATANEAIST